MPYPEPTVVLKHQRAPVRRVMLEARRRFENFGKRDGKALETAWVGLGTPSTYKAAVQAGYMVGTSGETPRVLNWYRLTAEGVALYRACFPEADLPYDAARAAACQIDLNR